MISRFKMMLLSKKQLSRQVFFYTFQLLQPEKISFLAGQFLNIKVQKEMWKPYSICSTPALKNKIELLVDISPAGEGSLYFEKLKEGDEVWGMGPFGNFTVKNRKGEMVFIATGSGIAPIRSMIKDLLETKEGIAEKKTSNEFFWIILFFGLRFREDLYFFEEFEDLEKRFANFKFLGTLSKPDEKWQGLKGRVTEHFDKIGNFQDKDFYICGAPDTVEDIKKNLVERGAKEERIYFEQY